MKLCETRSLGFGLECSEFTTMNEWIYNVGIELLGQLKSTTHGCTILVFLNDWPPERWLQSQKKELPDHRSFRHPWHFELFITSEKYRLCHQHGLDRGDPNPKQILHFSPGFIKCMWIIKLGAGMQFQVCWVGSALEECLGDICCPVLQNWLLRRGGRCLGPGCSPPASPPP